MVSQLDIFGGEEEITTDASPLETAARKYHDATEKGTEEEQSEAHEDLIAEAHMLDGPTGSPALCVAIGQLARLIDALSCDEKVQALNVARMALHRISPFKAEPVDCVLWARGLDLVNSVARGMMHIWHLCGSAKKRACGKRV